MTKYTPKPKGSTYGMHIPAKDAELIPSIKEIAERLDRNVNWCILQAMREYVKNNQIETPIETTKKKKPLNPKD